MSRRTLSILFICLGWVISPRLASAAEILMVLTGADRLALKDGTHYQTGYWLEEFTTPFKQFEAAGLKITIATPNGNRPTVDHGSASVGADGKPVYWPSMTELNEALDIKKRALDEGKILALAQMKPKDFEKYDAVFFPGGHGPMQDMIRNRHVNRLLRHFHAAKKTTALVCHAPIALLATESTGYLYKGYKVTAFSDSEEGQTPVGPKMKITPQIELERAGSIFRKGPDWQPHLIEDRELITGQNPASSKAIAEAVIKRLKKD